MAADFSVHCIEPFTLCSAAGDRRARHCRCHCCVTYRRVYSVTSVMTCSTTVYPLFFLLPYRLFVQWFVIMLECNLLKDYLNCNY